MKKKECLRCGYNWFPRIEEQPKYCPRCHNPNWSTEKPIPRYMKDELQTKEK